MLINSDRILWMRDGQVDHIDRREDLDIQVGQIEVHGEENAATSLNDH
ncbi:MAG: hypothetical protein IT441_09100 [Phycisphaeraceae bacterium]|nr:hypothetical protein [Phycisphaeraceae bacterium]